jgi:hypothetical protein
LTPKQRTYSTGANRSLCAFPVPGWSQELRTMMNVWAGRVRRAYFGELRSVSWHDRDQVGIEHSVANSRFFEQFLKIKPYWLPSARQSPEEKNCTTAAERFKCGILIKEHDNNVESRERQFDSAESSN